MPNKTYDPVGFEYPQAVRQGEDHAHKTVACKCRQFYFLGAVGRLVRAPYDWQKGFHPPACQLVRHDFLVTRAGPNRVPVVGQLDNAGAGARNRRAVCCTESFADHIWHRAILVGQKK